MKTIQKLRNLAAVLVLAAGMTSCLKTSEPDFMVGPASIYILQEGTGKDARFMPCVYLYGNKPISHSMLSTVCKFEDKKYYFEEVTGSGGYYLEMTSMMNQSVDTIKTWRFDIQAQSKVESETEQPETAVYSITLNSFKSLGDFTADELEYKDDKVTATWDKVENATGYVLMYRSGISNMWLPGNIFHPSEKDGRLTGSVSFLLKKGERFQIAIAAENGALRKVASQKFVTGTYEGL